MTLQTFHNRARRETSTTVGGGNVGLHADPGTKCLAGARSQPRYSALSKVHEPGPVGLQLRRAFPGVAVRAQCCSLGGAAVEVPEHGYVPGHFPGWIGAYHNVAAGRALYVARGPDLD